MSPRQIDQQTLHEREQILLDAAASLIQKQGVEGLTMDKLVKEVPFSKGTVYNHFIGKEDLLLALCNRGMGIVGDLFRRAASFNGSSRERAFALHVAYLLYSRLYPMMFMLVISAKSPGVTEKASDRQREIHLNREADLSGGLVGVIQEALASGECKNPAGLMAEQIAFTNWSTSFGSIALMSKDFEQCGIRAQLQSEQAILANVSNMLDGLQWLPMSYEHDYNATLKRIKEEVFAYEMQILNEQGEALQL